MPEIVPVNALEIALGQLLRDKHTPVWSFYTPLGAARVWIFAQNYPELDGSELAVPKGRNPGLCVFRAKDGDEHLSIYTAEHRAVEVFEKMKLHPGNFQIISALGFEILRLYRTSHPDAFYWANLWADGCYHLSDDLIDILLERPPPPPLADQPQGKLNLRVVGEPERYLGPLRKFLAEQPNVRAAWIMMDHEKPATPGGNAAYLLNLLMRDPEDKSLLEKTKTMTKALTPVEMEWASAVINGDDKSLRKLAEVLPPFYQASDFLS